MCVYYFLIKRKKLLEQPNTSRWSKWSHFYTAQSRINPLMRKVIIFTIVWIKKKRISYGLRWWSIGRSPIIAWNNFRWIDWYMECSTLFWSSVAQNYNTYTCSIKKEGVRFVTLRGFSWVAFLAVTRGPIMSQADRLICPTRVIQCIDERIVVAK